jgi:transcriptional regulator with XRE-family HTH domain
VSETRSTSSLINLSVFGSRLREARLRMGIPQDKLGVMIGLDEHTASARISRYEAGIHEPPIKTARQLADALQVPLGYLYCDDDKLANIVLAASQLNDTDRDNLLALILERLDTAQTQSNKSSSLNKRSPK